MNIFLIKILLFFLFIPIAVSGQISISNEDIEIHTQLTLLTVEKNDISEFEEQLRKIAKLSQKIKLEIDYEWLTYKSDSQQYLFVNFSNGIKDILTLADYRKKFQLYNLEKEFDEYIHSIYQLDVLVNKNYIKQMLLPWSTVEQISVNEFPLTTMVEYKVHSNKINEFDNQIRKLVKVLKKTNYPYPLEGNRGFVGAYGTMTLVWFYDNRNDFEEKNKLSEWVKQYNKSEELQSILDKINELTDTKKVYKLTFKKELSY